MCKRKLLSEQHVVIYEYHKQLTWKKQKKKRYEMNENMRLYKTVDCCTFDWKLLKDTMFVDGKQSQRHRLRCTLV